MRRYKKNILVDIDNTLTTLDTVLNKMADYYSKEPAREEDVIDYNLSTVYGVSREESREFWLEHEEWLCLNSKLCPVLSTTIRDNFIEQDDNIYIVTARSRKYKMATIEWLQEHDINYDALIMTDGKTKKPIIDNLDIDVVIDDKPQLFYEMEYSDTTMVCVDYAYNRDVPCDMRIKRNGEIVDVC